MGAASRILITGATGFVGRAAAWRLLECGHRIRVVTRNAERARALFPDGSTVEIVETDLARGRLPSGLLAGCDAIVHSAGHPGPARASTLERLHVGATGALLDAALASASVRRFVHIASDAVVWSGVDLLDIDESYPYPERYIDPYSRTKAAGERLVLDAAARGLSTISLRPAVVWGAGDSTVLPILVRLARSPLGIPVSGDLSQPIESAHIDNLTDAIAASLGSEARGAYFIADNYGVSWRGYFSALIEAAGARPRFFPVPPPMARFGAFTLDRAAALLRLPIPLARFGVAAALTARRYDTSAARGALGWRARVGFEQGLASLSAWAESIGGAKGVAQLASRAVRPEEARPAPVPGSAPDPRQGARDRTPDDASARPSPPRSRVAR